MKTKLHLDWGEKKIKNNNNEEGLWPDEASKVVQN